MRYRLRTLMILLAIVPPLVALIYGRVEEYRRRQRATQQLREIGLILQNYSSAYRSDYLPPGARWRFPPGDMDDGVMTMTPVDYGPTDNRP